MTDLCRAVCYACFKPRATCVCARIPRVRNRTPVYVLQHPRERLHPIGTARFARLGLERVQVEVAWNAGQRDDRRPDSLPGGAAVLYPSRDAKDLSSLPEAERPRALVVLDGTWHTARTLHRDKVWLRALPHVRLSPAAPSRYRIRKEPDLDSVSTVEAIVEALRVLEPETAGLDDLLRAFDGMIDDQLDYIGRHEGTPRTKERRPLEFRKTPRALAEDFDRLVVAYAESARPDPGGERELVQCAAVDLASGRRFERILTCSFGVPSAAHLAHMELAPGDFADAPGTAAFASAFREFLSSLGPRRILAAWNQSTLDVIAEALAAAPSRAALKNAYRTLRGGGLGSLDDAVLAEGITPSPEPFHGRAALRVGRAVAMARHLNALALRPAPAAAHDRRP